MESIRSSVLLAACLSIMASSSPAHSETAVADLKTTDGRAVGTVQFSQEEARLVIRLDVHGVPEGPYAVHIHEKGVCEGDFESAGGHFNPTGAQHGFLSKDGPHAGDLPNIRVAGDGRMNYEWATTRVTLEEEKANSLFREGGTAFIIHEGDDDYLTDPSGKSGSRVACGVIRKP